MNRLRRGERAKIPQRVGLHLVAARYGTTPAAVREWPADDYMDALHFLTLTNPMGGGGGKDR